jgi:hypothetical protein
LCQKENRIAFVRPSLLLVAATETETVLVAKLDFKLESKLGTVVDRELCTEVLDINVGSKLGTVLDR